MLTFHPSDWRDSCAWTGGKSWPDRLTDCLLSDPRPVNFPYPRVPMHLKYHHSLASQLASLLPHWSCSTLSTQQASPQSRTEWCYCLQHKGIQVPGRKCAVNKLCFPLWCGGEGWGFEVQTELHWCLALVLTSCVSLGKCLRLPEFRSSQLSNWNLSTEQICECLLCTGTLLVLGIQQRIQQTRFLPSFNK